MTIQTDYDIGDRVYAIYNNRVVEFEIIGFVIKDHIEYIIKHDIYTRIDVNVYKTREEALTELDNIERLINYIRDNYSNYEYYDSGQIKYISFGDDYLYSNYRDTPHHILSKGDKILYIGNNVEEIYEKL